MILKKFLSLMLVAVLTTSMLVGCGNNVADVNVNTEEVTETEATSDIKVGVIYVGDENEGYTEAHMKGIDQMMETLGLTADQVIEQTTIPEDESCYDAAVDLAEQGCDIIFANSFGHESYLMQAAVEFPEVQFCHATGYQAASAGMDNFHNYFTAVYESRYVSGVVAGLKLKEMIDNGEITAEEAKMGYVGAFPYAEVVSGFTSFFLGAKSIVPEVTMEVQYTNSWADMATENEVASALIADGAVLISQHADTTGAPTACEESGVYAVGYNVDMTSVAPNTALTSATINWGPYYTYAVEAAMNGTEIATDWCKGYVDGAVAISALNDVAVAEGTADVVANIEAELKAGTLHVFDTATFTVGGSSIEDLIAEGGDFAKYEAYVSDGYFHESELQSAPAFDLRIDGILELTN